MKEDITKEPLINLIKNLTDLQTKIDMLELETEYAKKEYNKIISEIVRRFPNLENDVNLQPKTLGKRKTKL